MCGVTTYDETILQEYANDLYRQAKGLIFWTAVRYGLVVLIASWVISLAVTGFQKRISTDAANSGVIFVTILGIAAGMDAGRRKAFTLKLHAQQILCQRQTELNTRK